MSVAPVRFGQSRRALLKGQSMLHALAMQLAQSPFPIDTPDQLVFAVHIVESQWDSPFYDYSPLDEDAQFLISIVRYLRQCDCIPVETPADNSPSWDTSREEIDTDLILSASDRHNIGIAFAEYFNDMRRSAYSYFRKVSIYGRAHEAADFTASEAYAYAIEQVGRGTLDPIKLFEVRTWLGIVRTVRGRYFESIQIMSAPREEITLDSITGPGACHTANDDWSADELDYIIGLDDSTPDWVVDTVAALLALPDGTNEEQAALLKLRPATYRKRLQRTREYFSTRG